MKRIYKDQSWLPQPPDNFKDQVLGSSSASDIFRLSQYSLNEGQLIRILKKFQAIDSDQKKKNNFAKINLGFISNATTTLLSPLLSGTALSFKINLKIHETDFNQVAQAAFTNIDIFDGQRIDAILVALDFRGLPYKSYIGEEQAAENNLLECYEYIKKIVLSLHDKYSTKIILQNIAMTDEHLYGSYENKLVGSLPWLITKLNSKLFELDKEFLHIVDIATLASKLGLENWHDPKLWNIGKIPFAQEFAPIYSNYICRILAAIKGKSRRCLILDLDHTLWGGVIGDDGLEGIKLGNGDPTGEAYVHFQKLILKLRDRGVVLAVCSKNEDKVARLPFKKHPEMVIKESDIAVFQANWSDKASNIKAISEYLNLGLDSMVFVDDNPAERMQVRKELPEVAVPELPGDQALYGKTLLAAGYFEAVMFSDEDRKRADYYQGNAERAAIMSNSSDMASYLKSLEMEINFKPFDVIGRPRITQLINKSNQFNLTTKRYDENQVKSMESDTGLYTLQVRLKDIFGDNGMISVIICKISETNWEIDTWLMSCRVLGRSVEISVLQEIIKSAKKSGAKYLIGTYIPTERNIIVKEHYRNLGFKKTNSDGENETWQLSISEYQNIKLPIKSVDVI